MSAIAAAAPRRFRINRKTLMGALAHAYIWIWLAIFAMPFLTTLVYSLEKEGGSGYSLAAYDYVFGTFKDNLVLSFQATILTIVINLLISIPAAYAIVRFAVPAKGFVLSTLNLSLYTPAAVAGLSLTIAYSYFFHMPRTFQGLVAAYVVGSYPLMLLPIIVALRDLPSVFEEASRTLGANRLQTFFRIELPLLGPGISAGILLTFVIIFNEFLVTLFIAGPSTTTAALRVYNLTRTAGFEPSTAALATTMQFVSFMVVLIFFKFFGSRYLKGTYLI
jgi:ABC-type spermidine/putrescine transport system permease subunit II